MTYGKKWASSPEEAQLEALIDIANLLEKMDKKLFVVIKKLEGDPLDTELSSRRDKVRAALAGGQLQLPQLEGDE